MAQSVYSHQFIAAHAGAGGSYFVGAGFVAVIRSVTGFNANAIAPQAIQVHLTTVPVTIVQKNLNQQSDVQVDLRVVVLPGDTIVSVGGADCDVTVSGYLLSLP